MSLMLASLDYRVKEFFDEQHDVLDTGSPSLHYIERYYLRHSDLYSPGKIEDIGSLTGSQRAHVIKHLEFLMGRMSEEEKVEIAQMAERPFIRIPKEPGTIVEPPRRTYRLERDKLGRLHARDKKSGRFRDVPRAFREVR